MSDDTWFFIAVTPLHSLNLFLSFPLLPLLIGALACSFIESFGSVRGRIGGVIGGAPFGDLWRSRARAVARDKWALVNSSSVNIVPV